MKIAIVTFYTQNCIPYAKLSDMSKKAYCDKHGYSFFVHRKQLFPDRHPVWEKPYWILSHFHEFDYVVWMDADACIANLDFDIEAIFKDKQKSIFVSRDYYGWNCGIFAVKTNNISKEFLQDTISLYTKYKNARFLEQSCMSDLMDDKYKQQVCTVPTKMWNSYQPIYNHPVSNNFTDGDFVLHLPCQGCLPKTNPPYRVKRFTQTLTKMGLINE